MKSCRFCGVPSVGRYLLGWSCADHTAARLSDRPEPPDPAASLPPASPARTYARYGHQTVGPGDLSRFRVPTA